MIEYIFIAPTRGAPVLPRMQIGALAGLGLEGDHHAINASLFPPERQVTLIEIEHIEEFARSSGYPLAPAGPRRNFVTRGVRLNDLRGQRFTIGEAEFEGTILCEPCRKFGVLTHPDVVRFFVHKGGLCARVLRSGAVRVGDAIVPLPAPA